MSGKEKYKGLNEYLKYLRGELSERERYEFERDLEADPFLREALEGIKEAGPGAAEEDLLTLHSRLGKRLHRRRRTVFYAAAAAVASLLVIGTVFLNIYDLNPDKEDVSRFEQEIPVRTPPALSQSEEKDVPSGEVTAVPESVPEDGMADAAKEQNATSEPDEAYRRSASEQENGREPVVAVEAEPAPRPESKGIPGDEPAKKAAEIRETEPAGVRENLKSAEPAAGIKESDIPEDSEMILEYQTGQEEIVPVEQGTREAARDRRVSRTRDDRALDHRPEAMMQETLRPQLTAFPREAATGNIYPDQMLVFMFENGSGDTLSYSPSELDRLIYQPGFDRAIPEGGYQAFAEYILENLQYPASDSSSPLRAIELKFTVTDKGRLSNIVNLSNLSPEMADEVIRLLKRGPDWYYKQDPGAIDGKTIRLQILH